MTSLWLISALLTLLVLVWLIKSVFVPVYRWWRINQYMNTCVPTVPGRHWLRGTMPADMSTYRNHVAGISDMFPRGMAVRWFGFLRVLSCNHPETLADAMRHGPGKFELMYRFWRPWLGDGLVTVLNHKKWLRDRRLISPVFSPAMLREYVSVYKDACRTMLDLWADQVDECIDVGACMPRLTFDIIMKCAMGVDTDCQTVTNTDSPNVRFFRATEQAIDLTLHRIHRPWLWPDWAYSWSAGSRDFAVCLDTMHQYSMDLIRKRRGELETEKASNISFDATFDRSKDMLDILLTVTDESGTGLTDTEIREQVDTFLFAGRDTTSAALQWAMFYFVEHPVIQEKCRAEVQEVMAGCGGVEGFSHGHIPQLQYLSQFVMETLRHATILAQVFRVPSKDTWIDGVHIPCGYPTLINMLGIHFNRDVWPDPHRFDPDRVGPDQEPRHPYAFIPFSCGAHSCIGKYFALDELKVVLALILMRFKLLQDPHAEKPQWYQKAVARPTPNLIIRLQELY